MGPRTSTMRSVHRLVFLTAFLSIDATASAQGITAAGQPAQLDIRVAGERSIRVTLKPLTFKEDFPINPAVARRTYPAPALRLRAITRPVVKTVGALTVDVQPDPLTVTVTNSTGVLV